MTDEELRRRWPDNPIDRLWFGCMYRNKRPPGSRPRGRPPKNRGSEEAGEATQLKMTEEEKQLRKQEYQRRQNEKRAAERRAAGMKEQPKYEYASEEDKHAQRLARKRAHAEQKRRERGAPVRRVFANEEERKAAEAEGRRRWKEEHPESVAESIRRRKEKIQRMKTEDPEAYAKLRQARNEQWKKRQQRLAEQKAEQLAREQAEAREQARADFDAKQAELEAARAALPENGSWLREWCADHGLDPTEARLKAGLGGDTWSILWRGGKTIPSLALTVGHNLGMTPEEVAHLGIIPDRHRWEPCGDDLRMEKYMPEHFDLRWPERVGGYDAGKVIRSLRGNQFSKPAPQPGGRVKNWPAGAGSTPGVMHKLICASCGKPFLSRTKDQMLCGRACAAAHMRQVRSDAIRQRKAAEAADG